MLKKRIVYRKNKRGNVVKISREHYLRDDIPCGYPLCSQCPQTSQYTLEAEPAPVGGSARYFIIDSDIAIYQMDILEHRSVKNIVVLYTVLDEVRENSIALYHRLRDLAADPEKHFYIFANEFSRDTFVERNSGETPRQRNRRAVLHSLRWYSNRLEHTDIRASLLTSNPEMLGRCEKLGLKGMSLADYALALSSEAPELLDMIVDTSEEKKDGQERLYEEYWSASKMSAGLKSGRLYQGKLAVSGHNLFEGSIFASIEGIEMTVKIQGKQNLNRAIHDDVVVVEVLPKSEWNRLAISAEIDEDDEEDRVDGQGKNLEDAMDFDPTTVTAEDIPYARVVGVTKRNWRPLCGIIDSSRVFDAGSTMQKLWFYPLDRKVPRVRIQTRQAHNLVGKKLIVSIDQWSVNELYPKGHFVRVIGDTGDKGVEMEALLLEHDVPFRPFSQEILHELPREGDQWTVNDGHLAGREDLRDLKICSIDPPGCTDIDDALHCRALENGNFECGVHIADVTHFVKPGTKMDEEAAHRGTTVYLVDKRIDMLPPLLGTNLCSLHENVDRLAFSVIWELSPDGEVVSARYAKTVIRSVASFTYAEAQARIDDKSKTDELTQSIRYLNQIAKSLRNKRMEKGSIVLSSPEVRFKLEHDSQDPLDLELKDLKETNALVEEFMLLANISVARKIFQDFPEVAVLRRHPKPEATNFESLNKQLSHYGVKLSVGSSKELALSLDGATKPGDPYFNNLVRILTTRCMMQAKYFCSSSFSYQDFWHYGLATDIYTHFTSPIRRYADVLVHRLLHACIDASQVLAMPSLFDRAKISAICDNINTRHHMAQLAGRSSVELYTNLFFKGKVVVEDGYVIRVLKNGIGVLIPKFGIEGFVYSANSGQETSLLAFDSENFTLSCKGVMLRTFSSVRVRITIDETGVAGLRQKLRMHLVEPNVPGLSVEVAINTQ